MTQREPRTPEAPYSLEPRAAGFRVSHGLLTRLERCGRFGLGCRASCFSRLDLLRWYMLYILRLMI